MSKSIASKKSVKPQKPYPSFPLFAHATKRWAKKIKGRFVYFGPWDDPDAALRKYLENKDRIYAGLDPQTSDEPEGFTLARMANDYLTAKQHDLSKGKITHQHFANLHTACARLIKTLGGRTLAADISPRDFERLRFAFPSSWGLRRTKREIGNIRGIFTYAYNQELIPRLRFGTFKAPSKDELNAERFRLERESGGRCFTEEELQKIIAAAPQPLRAMTYLGINGALGNTDLASLPIRYLDLKSGWLAYPRVKTAVPRRCYLWKETRQAVEEALAARPKAAKPELDSLAFLTAWGLPFVRSSELDGRISIVDDISKSFRHLLQRLGIHRRGLSFYSLRHTCRTHLGPDETAADTVLGHVHAGMRQNYLHGIDDARLIKVSETLHQWLFGDRTCHRIRHLALCQGGIGQS